MSPGIYQDVHAVTAEDEAYRHIHAAIRLGRYGAGQRLVPETIAAEIGVSRMPVREAFRRLATEGLVTIRPNRGVTVNGLNVSEMQEVFEMRAVLEGLAVRLALPYITPRVMRQLEALLDRLDDGEDLQPDWTAAHREFHETLCALSGRPRLMRQIAGLHSLVEPHMRVWVIADRPTSARAHHQSLIDALRSGDAQRCEETVREHVLVTVADVMKHLANATAA
jgi:DNA-binding GntR family transcriptional regulator